MEIKNIDLSHQRNDENFGLMTDVLRKLQKQTPTSIDVPAAMLTRFGAAVANQDTSYKIVEKSAYTNELSKINVMSDASPSPSTI